MAQDFQLGRAGLAAASGGDGLKLRCDSWAQDGDEAKVSGFIVGRDSDGSALADIKALRDQLQGYGPHNRDEPVVPVTWVQDSSRDGFYAVQRVDVSSELTKRLDSSASYKEVAYGFKADLLRVTDSFAPMHEIPHTGNVRVNDHSILVASVIPGVGLPVGYLAEVRSSTNTTITDRTSAEGTVRFVIDGGTPSSGFPNLDGVSWSVAPSNHYKGSCRVETSADSGTTWRSVTGRQVPNRPTYWRVSNALVRATATATASKTELSVEHYDGSQWETAKVWQITQDTSFTALAYAPETLTILRNSPDMVTVRVRMNAYSLDVTLRRGSRNVECYVRVHTGTTGNVGVRRGTNEAATALSTACGLRATADDAGGNKYVVATPLGVTTDTTIGAIRPTAAADVFPFVIGMAIGGTVGTTVGGTMGEALVYMAAISHRQNMVAV